MARMIIGANDDHLDHLCSRVFVRFVCWRLFRLWELPTFLSELAWNFLDLDFLAFSMLKSLLEAPRRQSVRFVRCKRLVRCNGTSIFNQKQINHENKSKPTRNIFITKTIRKKKGTTEKKTRMPIASGIKCVKTIFTNLKKKF